MFYTYKITFVDGFYYYGVRQTSLKDPLDDPYTGSPVTFKEKWNNTSFFKEVLGTYETWEEATQAETNLIKPVYKSDPFCLNRNCQGAIHPNLCKIGGTKKSYKNRVKDGRKGGLKVTDKKTGIHDLDYLSSKQKSIDCSKGGKAGGAVSGLGNVKSGHMQKIQPMGALVQHSQRWVNTHPDFEPFVSTPCGLSHWQKKRGIPKSFRKKVEQ